MINWATEDEVNRFANLESRVLTRNDFPEFAQAYRESIESMSTYLDLGYFSQQRPYLEMLKYFQSMITHLIAKLCCWREITLRAISMSSITKVNSMLTSELMS